MWNDPSVKIWAWLRPDHSNLMALQQAPSFFKFLEITAGTEKTDCCRGKAKEGLHGINVLLSFSKG